MFATASSDNMGDVFRGLRDILHDGLPAEQHEQHRSNHEIYAGAGNGDGQSWLGIFRNALHARDTTDW